jgi:hypothetical protein
MASKERSSNEAVSLINEGQGNGDGLRTAISYQNHVSSFGSNGGTGSSTGTSDTGDEQKLDQGGVIRRQGQRAILVGVFLIGCVAFIDTFMKLPRRFRSHKGKSKADHNDGLQPVGPYQLLERQEGQDFFKYYNFFNGEDSEGSAGYQHYVGPKSRAESLGLVNVTKDDASDEEFVLLNSKPTTEGMRQSLRLEGKRRFERGLFILDVRHMPVGCGVWPAFWLTDEDAWPKNGEIDILEGVNYQTSVKTALHTSEDCDMFAHVPSYSKTGKWDRAQCLPDTFTGKTNCETSKEADNCWNMAPHQWENQGCVLVDERNTTIGQPLNQQGGGVYALEWDPANGYIKSWVFSPKENVPHNLAQSMDTAGDGTKQVIPDPDQWDAPYAFFAIGEGSGCSADHFKNMRIIFNLAFCGTVAGNRYFTDCPAEITNKFNVTNDPWVSCNAYIASNPKEMDDAYWKIRGVYVYEREMM